MTLPISSIVDVNVSISPTVPAKAGFGTAAIVSPEATLAGSEQVERIAYYSLLSELADVFAITSETYKCAEAYFSQSPSPSQIAVIAQYAAGSSARLFGGTPLDVIATWNAITDGSFEADISDTVIDVTGMDFSAAVTMNDVADVMEVALKAASGFYILSTVVYNAAENRFDIDSGVFGGAIGFFNTAATGTDIVANAAFDAANGATLQQGVLAENEVTALSSAETVSNDWYGVLMLKSVRDSSIILDVAAWAESRIKLFSASTNNPASMTIGDTACTAYLLFNSNYQRTTCVFSSDDDAYPDAAVLGKAFTTNFSSPNSTITMKFKPLAGIVTERLTTTQKAGLDEKRCNALLDVAGTSMYAESYMCSQLFFDERHGIDWMVGEIESNVFSYLISRTTKIPLTDKGGASLQQQVIRALDASVKNGLVAAGTTSNGEFLGNGYVTLVQKVADMNPADKANRIAPTISFTALLAGAVHSVQINGTVER